MVRLSLYRFPTERFVCASGLIHFHFNQIESRNLGKIYHHPVNPWVQRGTTRFHLLLKCQFWIQSSRHESWPVTGTETTHGPVSSMATARGYLTTLWWVRVISSVDARLLRLAWLTVPGFCVTHSILWPEAHILMTVISERMNEYDIVWMNYCTYTCIRSGSPHNAFL